MAVRECDCKEFQDSGHTEECDEYYATLNIKRVRGKGRNSFPILDNEFDNGERK